jgi:hypothetical protein
VVDRTPAKIALRVHHGLIEKVLLTAADDRPRSARFPYITSEIFEINYVYPGLIPARAARWFWIGCGESEANGRLHVGGSCDPSDCWRYVPWSYCRRRYTVLHELIQYKSVRFKAIVRLER